MSVELDNVHLGALRGATLSLATGSLSTVLGRPGDGLSELAETLAGAAPPKRGRVRVLGGDPQVRPDLRALSASLLPREPGMTEGTVGEWVGRVLTARGSATTVEKLLADFGLSSWVGRQTLGLDSADRRRVAAALALGHERARLHVFYEPQVGLTVDPVSACIGLQNSGSTVIVLTGSVQLAAALGGEIYLLQGGLFVDSSTRSPGLVASGSARIEVSSPEARELARRLLSPTAEPVDLHTVTDDRLIVAAESEERAASALTTAAAAEPGIDVHAVRRIPEQTRELQIRTAAERQYAYDRAYAAAAQRAQAEHARFEEQAQPGAGIATTTPRFEPPSEEGPR